MGHAQHPALNGVGVGLVVLGILLQAVSAPEEEDEKNEPSEEEKPEAEKPAPAAPEPKNVPWWKKLLAARKSASSK